MPNQAKQLVQLLKTLSGNTYSHFDTNRQEAIARGLLKKYDYDLLEYAIRNSEHYTKERTPISSLKFLYWVIDDIQKDWDKRKNVKDTVSKAMARRRNIMQKLSNIPKGVDVTFPDKKMELKELTPKDIDHIYDDILEGR